MEKYKLIVKGIVKSDDKYLIIKKWYDDRISDPYQWEFIDGKVEFGESPDKAVVRIIGEDTGVMAAINRILYTWSFMVGDVCNIGIAYECIGCSDAVFLSEELSDYCWIKKEEFHNYIKNEMLLKDVQKSIY